MYKSLNNKFMDSIYSSAMHFSGYALMASYFGSFFPFSPDLQVSAGKEDTV